MKTVFGVQMIADLAYTYRDYIILPTPHEGIDPRTVSTQTFLADRLKLNIPIVGANMGHMGARMAEKLAQLGGIGIFSQDFRVEEIVKRIDHVKSANPYLHMPIVLHPNDRVADALSLMDKRHFDCVVVVDAKYLPIGLATQSDLTKVAGWEILKNVMKTEMIVVLNTISTEEASRIMIDNKINHLPVVDRSDQLVGCLTPLDITLRLHQYKPALNRQRQLMVGVAMGIKPKETFHPVTLARYYIEKGVDVLVLDIANGYLKNFVDFVAEVRKEIGPDFPIIAGNVADYDGAMRLYEVGVDTIKVGIGPGGACTTRRETGVGVPQATAVLETLKAAEAASIEGKQRYILADGGIRSSFDLAVAMLMGSTGVMIGSYLAGTYESAFETEIVDGILWKRWRGNASSSAATYRREKIYGDKYITEDLEYSEGADGQVKVVGSVAHKIFQLVEGLKQRIAYSSATDIGGFRDRKDQILRLRHINDGAYRHFSQLRFDDLYIKPQPSEVLSRKHVDIAVYRTPSLYLNIPYVALPADFIQKKICTIMAQLGGLGFVSRKKVSEDISLLVQRVRHVRTHHPGYFFPSIQDSQEEIGKTIDFIRENAFSCAIIVKDARADWTPIGIATPNDLQDRPRTDPLNEVINNNIVTVKEGVDWREASELMLKKGIHHLPVVNEAGKLVGCITPRDMTLRVLYGLRPNVDKDGKLVVGAALHVDDMRMDVVVREAIELDKTGIYMLLLETDDGFSAHYLELLRRIRTQVKCRIMAAGVSTYLGAIALFDAGADVIKVGSKAGEVPYVEAINQCAKAAQEAGKAIITDDRNTIQHPRDANLCLLLGANAVGLRDSLAPTYENAAQAAYGDQGQPKITPLLRSRLVRREINQIEYIMEDIALDNVHKNSPLKFKTSIINVVVRYLTGLRSSCTYSNAGSIEEYQYKAIIGVQSPAGYNEGNPHAFG